MTDTDLNFDLDGEPGEDAEPWFDVRSSERYAPHVPTVDHGPVEVWLRNAHEYQNVISASPYPRFAFTLADLSRKAIDLDKMFARMMPVGYEYEWLVLGRTVTLHYESKRMGELNYEPLRIPTWTPANDPDALVRLCESGRYERIAVGWLERGQAARARNQVYLDYLYRVAAAYPQVKLHFVLGSSFRQMFGLNFASVDYNPVFVAKHNRIWLPNGRTASKGAWAPWLKWIHVLGYSVTDLESFIPRVRFNIASALWAAEHYREAEPITSTLARNRDQDPLGVLALRRSPATNRTYQAVTKPKMMQKFYLPHLDPDRYPQTSPDMTEPYAVVRPVTAGPLVVVNPKQEVPNSRDKILCDACSLAPKCRVYRKEAICAVSSSPTSRLADSFGTRDTEVIKGVLGEILARQVDRYERSAKRFREEDESDVTDLRRAKHLLEMETSLVRSTETFMKILDPTFRESNVPSVIASQTNIYNPRVLVADVVKQLEASGIDRAQLTPEMIQGAIESRGSAEVIQG